MRCTVGEGSPPSLAFRAAITDTCRLALPSAIAFGSTPLVPRLWLRADAPLDSLLLGHLLISELLAFALYFMGRAYQRLALAPDPGA